MVVERARLFLSYSRKDGARVADISRVLDVLGHDVWRDTEDLHGGEAWRRSIVQGIRASDVVVLLLSPNSTVSDNVRRELDIADEERRPVLPVVLAATTVPDEMRYNLAGLQLLDLTELSPPDAAERISAAVADRAPVPSSRWSAPAGADASTAGAGSTRAGVPAGSTGLLDAAAVAAAATDTNDAGVTAGGTSTSSATVGSGSGSGSGATASRQRVAVAVGVGVAAALALAGAIAWVARDRWAPSPSTMSVPCVGVGPDARTAIKGDGATPKSVVRSSWRNLLTGQAGENDASRVDGDGRFRIGFECLPSERGQAWVVTGTDGTHSFRWTVNGVAP